MSPPRRLVIWKITKEFVESLIDNGIIFFLPEGLVFRKSWNFLEIQEKSLDF